MAWPRAHAHVLLEGGTLVTMNPEFEILEADLLISEGRIAAMGKNLDLPPATRLIDARNLTVLPGLIQGHTHLGQALFRGLAEGRTLLPWLEERIWPFEAAHSEESAYWSGMLGAVDCLLSGTTTVNDMGLPAHTGALARAVADSGIRAILGPCLMDRGENVPANLLQTTEEAVQAVGAPAWELDCDRLSPSLCPRFTLSCSEPVWRACVEEHGKAGKLIHTHLLESRAEAEAARRLLGQDQFLWLRELGVLDTHLRAAHGVWFGEDELRLLEDRPLSVMHCPSSNLKLASGVAPIPLLRDAPGIRLGLGCDGAPCNNGMDLLQEMRVGALLQENHAGPGRVESRFWLEMATIEGARALGKEGELGSLEVGKRGDVVVLDLGGPSTLTAAAADPYARIVYAASRETVRWVLVGGEIVVDHGDMPFVDLDAVLRNARREADAVLSRAELR